MVLTAAAAPAWDQAYARLRAAAAELGDPDQRFAVRSSASAEDLAGASFAGQYETVLDVGLDELPDAVRQVLDSAASARVAAYRQAHPQAAPADPPGFGGGMAVLVQVMVPADAAGVAFTANPLTGAQDEVVITAVRGLGERLVAGQATGEEWIVRDGRAGRTRATEQAISANQARQIATLARRVHAHLGSPQDLEWAITTDPTDTSGAEGGLWLLQARPMTALPDPLVWPTQTQGYWLRNLLLCECLP
jgi:phosphoenolpyruvate synthase/pyruvate phosphate dikinase